MSDNASKNDTDGNASNQPFMDKLNALPSRTKVILVIVFVLLLYVLVSSGNKGSEVVQQPIVEKNVTTQNALEEQGNEVYEGLEIDTPNLMRSWFQQNERDLADLRDAVENKLSRQDESVSSAMRQNEELQREIRQILEDYKSEMLNIQQNRSRDREVMAQLAEDTRKLQLNAPANSQVSIVPQQRKRTRISQTPLGSPVSAVVSGNQALLGGVVSGAERIRNGQNLTVAESEEEVRRPFIPPLGFIKASLLNGVDALVGGTATPSLVRLHGVYKTAHNSTVNLDGCFALVEFSGEISTERAIGKPSRMTCVYPDQGVTTYSVSGYVVDADDGIIGVPGIFYEGDATRLAAAVIADFAAGVADIIEQNQSTFTTNSDGDSQQTLTGSQAKAEIAGGVGTAVSSLRDYLFERANRILPFVRIDATRQIHMVLLSGVELRAEGSPWTLLYAADE